MGAHGRENCRKLPEAESAKPTPASAKSTSVRRPRASRLSDSAFWRTPSRSEVTPSSIPFGLLISQFEKPYAKLPVSLKRLTSLGTSAPVAQSGLHKFSTQIHGFRCASPVAIAIAPPERRRIHRYNAKQHEEPSYWIEPSNQEVVSAKYFGWLNRDSIVHAQPAVIRPADIFTAAVATTRTLALNRWCAAA